MAVKQKTLIGYIDEVRDGIVYASLYDDPLGIEFDVTWKKGTYSQIKEASGTYFEVIVWEDKETREKSIEVKKRRMQKLSEEQVEEIEKLIQDAFGTDEDPVRTWMEV